MSDKPQQFENHDTDGKSAIMNLYAAFGVCLVLSAIPIAAAAVFSVLAFPAVLIAAYIIRRKYEMHSFAENHASYVIRSVWISALLSLFTSIVATFYMMSRIDYSPFNSCANDASSRGVDWIEGAGFSDVYAMIEPCAEPFMMVNHVLFVNMALIIGVPILLYLAYRLAKGASRAMKGYRLADNKSWF